LNFTEAFVIVNFGNIKSFFLRLRFCFRGFREHFQNYKNEKKNEKKTQITIPTTLYPQLLFFFFFQLHSLNKKQKIGSSSAIMDSGLNDSTSAFLNHHDHDEFVDGTISILSGRSEPTAEPSTLAGSPSRSLYRESKGNLELWRRCTDDLNCFSSVFQGAGKLIERVETLLEDRNRWLRITLMGRTGCGKTSFLNDLFFGENQVLPEGTGAKAKTPYIVSIVKSSNYSITVKFASFATWGSFRRGIVIRALRLWDLKGKDKNEKTMLLKALKEWYPELASLSEEALKEKIKPMGKKSFEESPTILALLGTRSIIPCSSIDDLKVKLFSWISPKDGSRPEGFHLVEEIQVGCRTDSIPFGVVVADTPGFGDRDISKSMSRLSAESRSSFTLLMADFSKNEASSEEYADFIRKNEPNRYAFVLTRCDLQGLRNCEERYASVEDDFKELFLTTREEEEQAPDPVPPILFSSVKGEDPNFIATKKKILLLVSHAGNYRLKRLQAISQVIYEEIEALRKVVEKMLDGILPLDPRALAAMASLKESFQDPGITVDITGPARLPGISLQFLARLVSDEVDGLGRAKNGSAAWHRIYSRNVFEAIADEIVRKCISKLIFETESAIRKAAQQLQSRLEDKALQFRKANGIRASRSVTYHLESIQENLLKQDLRRIFHCALVRYFEGLSQVRAAYKKSMNEMGSGSGFTARVARHFSNAIASLELEDFLEHLEKQLFDIQDQVRQNVVSATRSIEQQLLLDFIAQKQGKATTDELTERQKEDLRDILRQFS
jgi:hypothetical protein